MDIDSKDEKMTRPRMDIDTFFPSKLSPNFIKVDLPLNIHYKSLRPYLDCFPDQKNDFWKN